MNQEENKNSASHDRREADGPKQSLAERAARIAAKTHKLKDPIVLDRAEASEPKSGVLLYLFRVGDLNNANGPSYPVILNDRGEAVEISSEMEALFDRTVLTTDGARPALPSITIQPGSNVLTLNPGDTTSETITVTIPKNAGPVKADVYFLADTTASMGNILSAVQAGANNILAALGGLGVDMTFGVGNYKDFAPAIRMRSCIR